MQNNQLRALALTLKATPGAVADGHDTSTVTVTLEDDSNWIAGESINLYAASPTARFASSGKSETVVVTNALGMATDKLTNTVAETVHLTAAMANSSLTQAAADVSFEVAALLPAPALRESSGGSVGAAAMNMDVVHVEIPAWSDMTDGQELTFYWRGTLVDGGNGPVYTLTHMVTLSEVGEGVVLAINVEKYLAPYAGGRLLLSYEVDGTASSVAELNVDSDSGTLAAPSVDEAPGTSLWADMEALTLRIPPWPDMAAKDLLMYSWKGTPQVGTATTLNDGMHVPAEMVGKDITFTLDPVAAVMPYVGGVVEVWYQVTPAAGGGTKTSLLATWQVDETVTLPAPIITESVDEVVDPETVGDNVHVRIAYPDMTDGDKLELYWEGIPADDEPNAEDLVVTHTVTISEVVAGTVMLMVNAADYLIPYDGGQVAVRYGLTRSSGGGGESGVAKYSVSKNNQPGTGTLKVMGARSQRKCSSLGVINPVRRLVALDAESLTPVSAIWQYEGSMDSFTSSDFADISPDLILHVRTDDDHVALNPANINGNSEAMVARRNTGNVVAWGSIVNGGSVPATIATLTDIVEIVTADRAVAARRANGTVVAWGNTVHGGVVPESIANLTDIVALYSTSYAFAALRENGSVVAWGDLAYGGSVPATIAGLTDIVAISGNARAFVAQRNNGAVVAWGVNSQGGEVPSVIAELNDITAVVATEQAFAALRKNGRVVAWGYHLHGGEVPSTIATLDDIVEVIGGHDAFAARRASGQVVAWGTAGHGGEVPTTIASLNDIVSVSGNEMAFAALRANGSVVAWGIAGYGGTVPSTIATLDDIVSVTSNQKAFAALRANGRVVSWGISGSGGAINDAISAQLTDVCGVYCANYAFAAITEDSRVVTWGENALGGNSSDVQPLLEGQVSYKVISVLS